MEIRCRNTNIHIPRQTRDQRIHNTPQRDRRNHKQQEVIDKERSLPRHKRLNRPFTPQPRIPPNKQPERKHQAQHHERQKQQPQRRLRKRMHRDYTPPSINRHPKLSQHKRDTDQNNVPHPKHPPPPLNHDRMNKRRQHQPWHHRNVLYRIPTPISAPAEDRVRPPRTEQHTNPKDAPHDDCEDPGDIHPIIPVLT